MPRRLALFDCDGTLVDGQHMVVRAMRAAFEGEGVPVPSDAAIRHVIGLHLSEAIAGLLDEGDPKMVRRLVESYRDAYRSLRLSGVSDPVFAGIPELLASLREQDVALGIVTGKSRVGMLGVLATHGWTEWFCVVKTADDGPGKPDPTIVRHALKETGIPAGEATVVGDTRYDMAMATAAGVEAIGVGWGYHARADLLAAGAITVVDTVSALKERLGSSGR